MDILTDTLAAMRTGPPAAVCTDARAPWGLRFRPLAGAGFHIVLRGSCLLVPSEGVAGRWPVRLDAGDLVFLRSGRGHVLTDDPASAVQEFHPTAVDRSTPIGRITAGGDGAAVRILCGAYVLDTARPHPLLRDIPEIIRLPADRWRRGGLDSAIDLLRAEVEEPRPGSNGIVPALIDAMLLYILRAWFDEHGSESGGWATALADPVIGGALRAIHEEPSRHWTVESLAMHGNLSRATFARRFQTLVGETPLAYVTRWRLTVAASRLRDTDATLSRIAREVGYATEFAFAKAFKREYGCSPGGYRREMRAGAATEDDGDDSAGWAFESADGALEDAALGAGDVPQPAN